MSSHHKVSGCRGCRGGVTYRITRLDNGDGKRLLRRQHAQREAGASSDGRCRAGRGNDTDQCRDCTGGGQGTSTRDILAGAAIVHGRELLQDADNCGYHVGAGTASSSSSPSTGASTSASASTSGRGGSQGVYDAPQQARRRGSVHQVGPQACNLSLGAHNVQRGLGLHWRQGRHVRAADSNLWCRCRRYRRRCISSSISGTGVSITTILIVVLIGTLAVISLAIVCIVTLTLSLCFSLCLSLRLCCSCSRSVLSDCLSCSRRGRWQQVAWNRAAARQKAFQPWHDASVSEVLAAGGRGRAEPAQSRQQGILCTCEWCSGARRSTWTCSTRVVWCQRHNHAQPTHNRSWY